MQLPTFEETIGSLRSKLLSEANRGENMGNMDEPVFTEGDCFDYLSRTIDILVLIRIQGGSNESN